EREQLLKNIEQMRSTTKNSIIQYNRFILQTTTKVNELSEKKTILDRDLREEQLQVNDFDDKLKTLKTEYSDMKVRFEQAIQQLEESTSQLILSIDKNRKRVQETQPGYNLLCEEFEKVTSIYEATKESMIETKRKKQEFVDKITKVQRQINDKTKSRNITILAVKESQKEQQQQMSEHHTEITNIEEDIYEKGCRLETLQAENERFQQV
ncbi:unnamed protein product, partial [Didymodactylos carnosus]